MRSLCLPAAALLLAGCSTTRASAPAPAHRCSRVHLVVEPRGTATIGLNGSITPSIAFVVRPACAAPATRLPVPPDPAPAAR